MLDDEDFIFENFFLNVKGWQRTLEFIIRMVIISIVSYKIIEWKEVSQLSTYLKWLYGSLVAWGILVKTFKPFSKTYLLISVSGLAVAYFMDILMKFEINESVGVWILFLFIVIVLIMIDVGTDIKKNKEKYLSYFKTIFADMTNLIKTNNNNKGDEIKH